MFQWPWVSRGRYDDMAARCEELRMERNDLFARLFERPAVSPAPAATAVSEERTPVQSPAAFARAVAADVEKEMTAQAATESVDAKPRQYSTPFDSLGSRFRQTYGQNGQIPTRFRARAR